MPQRPVHAQPAAMLTQRRRKITKRAADLCRARPAAFAAVVREADRRRAEGVLFLGGHRDARLRQRVLVAEGRADVRNGTGNPYS